MFPNPVQMRRLFFGGAAISAITFSPPTRRRLMPDESLSRDKHPPAIRGGDFKTLSGVLRGYLHQDFHLEYKNPQAAAQAYCRDATRQQVDRARNELQRFLDKTRTV